MRKEIRENVEITIYAENEIANIKTNGWHLENHFIDYITAEDFQKVEDAKAERLEAERKAELQRTPQELAELKAELEKLENSKFFEEMAERIDRTYYATICFEIDTINEILKANE